MCLLSGVRLSGADYGRLSCHRLWSHGGNLIEAEKGGLGSMTWFFVSLIAPLIFSLVNHAEKIILVRYFQAQGVGGLMIFIGVISAPAAVILAIIAPEALAVGAARSGLLLGSGLFYAVSCVTYLTALQRHDASYVVPFWQLTPVFTYALGFAWLGEKLESSRLLGGVVVIFGAVSMSLHPTTERLRIDIRSIVLMTASSAALALGFVLFKFGGEGLGTEAALFWNQAGLSLVSGMFLLFPTSRASFLASFRQETLIPVVLNVGAQIFDVIAVIIANVAVRMAPAALVVLVEYAVQPLFVFLIGAVLTLIAPRWVAEDISPRTLLHRSAAICVMTLGVWIVLR